MKYMFDNNKIVPVIQANHLCHLIGTIEETILKLKELIKTTKVECENIGERNSTGDLQVRMYFK